MVEIVGWAQPLMELLSSTFGALGQLVHDTLPAGLLQSVLQNGVISGVGSYMLAPAYTASFVTYNVTRALGAG